MALGALGYMPGEAVTCLCSCPDASGHTHTWGRRRQSHTCSLRMMRTTPIYCRCPVPHKRNSNRPANAQYMMLLAYSKQHLAEALTHMHVMQIYLHCLLLSYNRVRVFCKMEQPKQCFIVSKSTCASPSAWQLPEILRSVHRQIWFKLSAVHVSSM